jgi:diketogulonate reductase-like aldo/keto reductase
LYAIHYPILLLLNVTVANSRQDFTLASVGLDSSFILTCLLAAAIVYFMFESRTPAIRDWLKGIMLHGIVGRGRMFRSTAIVDTVSSPSALAADRAMMIPSAGAKPPLQSSGTDASLEQIASPQARYGAPAANVPMVLLNDGHALPQLGFGVWQIDNARAPEVIATAMNAGYRLVDTAANYGNEASVGVALSRMNLPRSQLYVTTKLRNEDQGYDRTMRAFDASAARLQLDVIDLYLIHWPCPQRAAYVETWRALIELQKQGRVRSIGVSNFTADHLERIIHETGVTPAVNQIECHPAFQQISARAENAKRKVAVQSWSPLGQGEILGNAVLRTLAEKHDRTVAQIILRWHVQNDLIVIPKSVNENRMRENFDILAFTLDADDMATIATLDDPEGRMGPDPLTFE